MKPLHKRCYQSTISFNNLLCFYSVNPNNRQKDKSKLKRINKFPHVICVKHIVAVPILLDNFRHFIFKKPCDVTPHTKHVGLFSLLYDSLELEDQRARLSLLFVHTAHTASLVVLLSLEDGSAQVVNLLIWILQAENYSSTSP